MAKPSVERLNSAGLIGLAALAVVAVVQLASVSALIRLPAAGTEHVRMPLRLIVGAGAIATLCIVVAGMVGIVRGRRVRVQAARIAEIANMQSEFAAQPREQIQRLLEFTCASLGMEEGAVSHIEGGVLTVDYSVTASVPVGLTLESARTFARHIYGSREVLALADLTTGEKRDDPATLSQEWRAYVGATIFVGSKPFGMLSFTRRSPRAEAFDRADVDFMKIAGALVGAALERIRNEHALAQEARSDLVTGLANRAAFEDQLRMSMARVKRHGGLVRVHFIDLDGFKSVNDRFGHAAGDEVLRIVATRLRELLREDDFVARFGGDEFAVLEVARSTDGDPLALGKRIVAVASDMMYVAGQPMSVGASVGVAAFPTEAEDETALLARADAAMYQAKSSGKGSVRASAP
jgi:diguanylate cyclase (GGDEF)-like protein